MQTHQTIIERRSLLIVVAQ